MPLGHFAWKAGSRFSRYEILGRLSAGGMAEVWRARVLGVESFQKEIVIKTMRPELADTPDLVRMFINEAEIAARMNHPGMVQVFDFGQYEGRYFIAMEYVPGRSLRQLGRSLRLKQRRLPRAFFLRTILDVVRALGYGHGLIENGVPLGFVHRDVSPENVMVSYAGATKLIDFGAAATNGSPPPSSSVVGKLRYLSPERLRGNVGDARSDIYSVGVMLYEYLTGISPFDGQDMVKKIIEGQVPDIATKVSVPSAVARVVRRAMAADLRKRYGWADRLADELSALLAGDLGHDPYGADEGDVLELLHRAAAAPLEPAPGAGAPAAGPPGVAGSPGAPVLPAGSRPTVASRPPADSDILGPKLRVLPPLPSQGLPGYPGAPFVSAPTPASGSYAIATPPSSAAVSATPPPGVRVPVSAPVHAGPAAAGQQPPGPPAAVPAGPGRAGLVAPAAPRVTSVRSLDEPMVEVVEDVEENLEENLEKNVEKNVEDKKRVAPRAEAPSSVSIDPFAVVRRAGVNPVAAWFRDGRPEAALLENAGTPLSDDEAVAAACFERGLALVSEHRLQDAVVYWERAAALAPARRSYQANLRRLVAQIRDTKEPGGPPTPTPLRNLIRELK